MIEVIKKQWKMQWIYGEIGTLLACLGGPFLILFSGMIIFGSIYQISEPIEPVPVGMFAALIMAGFGQVILSCVGFMSEFNMAISLGETRKSFVWGYQLFGLFKIITIVLSVLLFGIIEHYAYRAAFGLKNWDFDIWELLDMINIGYLAVAIVGILAAEMLFQTLILRFGMKAFWVLWGVWMFVTLVLPRLTALPLWQPVKSFFSQVRWMGSGPVFWAVAALAASVLTMAVSWGMLRKQRVTV